VNDALDPVEVGIYGDRLPGGVPRSEIVDCDGLPRSDLDQHLCAACSGWLRGDQ
jgi:hypothetical protein